MLGQDVISCGATRLDVIFHIHSCILTYADSFYEASLRRPYSFHFCLPLEVHSDLRSLLLSTIQQLSVKGISDLTYSSSTVYSFL